MTDPRRAIPQVDHVVRLLQAEAPDLPRAVLVASARLAVERVRDHTSPGGDAALDAARAEIAEWRRRALVPVINATGVVLHTNLGRAPLAAEAVAAVTAVASGYSNLELDLADGRRGDRYEHVEPMLALATGAEAALVVNNNAAAVLLVCTALASGREVVISRGELIEIGGEFRIPEVLRVSGAILREVGTTNRTHLRDYESALSDDTALVLKVHPSNYRVVGFTATPATNEIADAAHSRGVPLVYDVGSGLLGSDREAGRDQGTLADEPSVAQALRDGADLVCFSGDKLLGGPQAGVICGRTDLVARLRQHPLVRALRPDKMTLAALGATVALWLGDARDDIPVWRMLRAPEAGLRNRCKRLARRLSRAGIAAEVADGRSVAGGGSLPGVDLPSPVVRVTVARAEAAAARLRSAPTAVIGRVETGALVLDLRTVAPRDDSVLAGIVERACAPSGFAPDAAEPQSSDA